MDSKDLVAKNYQLKLGKLKSARRDIIDGLTSLAFREVKSHEIIVDIIVKHTKRVSGDMKLYALYLIDSLLKKDNGQVYRTSFGDKLPKLMFEIAGFGLPANHYAVCEVRHTWNSLLPAHVLKGIDTKLKTIDPFWPHSPFELELMAKIQDVDKQLMVMRREVRELEEKATQEHQEQMCKRIAEMEKVERKNKRVRIPVSNETPLKKVRTEENLPSPTIDHTMLLSQHSSVLLTPSPEPQSPALTSEGNDSNDNTFWTTISSIFNEANGSVKSNSPTSNSPTNAHHLPFLFDSPSKCSKIIETNEIECGTAELMDESTVNIISNADQISDSNVNENVSGAYEPLDFNASGTGSFINFECTDEPLTAISNIEHQHGSIDEVNNFAEPSRTISPPMTLSIDGNIEYQAITRNETAKQIKINLINPMVAKDLKNETTAKKIAEKEMMQNNPSEWKTPHISYDVKDSMKNATFQSKPIYRKGVDKSGMCSIM